MDVPFGNVGRVWAVFIAHRDHRIFEMLDLMHPDVVWVRPGPTEHRGHDGVRQMLRDLEATGGYAIQLDDVTETEPGVVVADGQVVLRGTDRGTGASWRVDLVDGLITRIETLLPGPGVP